ncbi:MAG TPA: DUF2254 family protein, partial [Kofleriaceae bacterium]|nr:DUF2254 family protein [Kofleriaceae bacterium]
DAVGDYVFGKPQGTSSVLGSIAGGVITMTSIIVTVLLVALQQSSTNLTPQVFDQFLRRRQNQVFFGYFVGLAIFTLIVLASIDSPFTPVFGALVTLAATLVALLMMITMLYSTITQMRPVVIISAIHAHVLRARGAQRTLIARTRRRPRRADLPVEITADLGGFVTSIDVDALASIARDVGGEVELTVSIGGFVATGDVIALWRGGLDGERIERATRRAVHIERRRDITRDPAYGIEQLQTIGWSAISSAKHNQEAGLLCIRLLRDVLGCWAASGDLDVIEQDARHAEVAVVYRDNVAANLLEAFELLGMVTAESFQQQCLAAVLDSFSAVYGRLSARSRERADQLLLHLLAPLAEQTLTSTLDNAASRLEDALRAAQANAVLVPLERTHEALCTRATRLREVGPSSRMAHRRDE